MKINQGRKNMKKNLSVEIVIKNLKHRKKRYFMKIFIVK